MIYSLLGVSFVVQKLSVGGRPAPPTSLILQKCVIMFPLRLIANYDTDKNVIVNQLCVSCIKIIVIDQSGFRPAGGRNGTGV